MHCSKNDIVKFLKLYIKYLHQNHVTWHLSFPIMTVVNMKVKKGTFKYLETLTSIGISAEIPGLQWSLECSLPERSMVGWFYDVRDAVRWPVFLPLGFSWLCWSGSSSHEVGQFFGWSKGWSIASVAIFFVKFVKVELLSIFFWRKKIDLKIQ